MRELHSKRWIQVNLNAKRSKLSHPTYDCIYLAAAMDLGCSFITADSRLLNKLRQQGFAAVKCVDLAAAEAL
jgi:predicted nucleic acid-binding protein